jgi:5-methylcytosine-specific restriction endonuclease McrA
MRQFEIDDIAKAAAGDRNAQMRVQRRKDVLQFEAEKRKNAMAWATPAWGDKKAIAAIYAEARMLTVKTGIPHEVDHIVPIQGAKVCGLHVEYNLQILTKSENVRKHSKFDDQAP